MYPGYNVIINTILAFVRLRNLICSQFLTPLLSILCCSAAPTAEPLTRELRETGMLYLREVNIGEKDHENSRGKNKGASSNQLLAWLQERGLEFMVRPTIKQ